MVEPYSVGTVRTNGYAVESERKYTAASVDPHFEQVDPGKNGILHDADDIPRVDAIWNPPITTQIRTQRSFIRFDFSGRLYRIVQVETGTSPAELVLDNSGPVPPVLGFGTQYQIFGPPIPVPQTEGVLLPEGIVIDVRFAPIVTGHPFEPDPTLNIPRSKGIPNQVPPAAMAAAVPGTWPRMEILFSPNGQVIGDAAAQPLIHFWVGERGDKGPDPVASRGTDGMPRTTDDVRPTRHHMLVTLNTRTAAVTVQHNPGTASLAAWPPPANSPPDFYADMYRTAEELLGVSVLP
jgi:hypothetical protein